MKTFLVVAVVSLLLFLNALQSQACSPSSPPPQDDKEWREESVNISLSFKTRAANGPIIYIGISETASALFAKYRGHKILNLSLSDGGLHLQVHPDTSIGPLIEDSGEILRLDDQEWHDVHLSLNGGRFKFIAFKVDDIEIFKSVSELPLLSNAEYQTWLGGLPPSLSEESEAPYVGCIRDIRVLDTDRDLQDLQLTGAIVEECDLSTLDFTTPTFQGSLLGVISETHQVGSVVMNIQAVTGDRTSQMIYELIENPQNYFALDQTTGSLTIARQLDRLALAPPNNVLTLTVTARAGSGKH